MSTALTIRARGDRELLRALARLAVPRTMLAAVRSANAKTSTVMKKKLQAETPVDTGSLKRSWGKQSITRAHAGELISVIGIRRQWRDPKTKKIPNKYARKVDEKNPFVDEAFEAIASGGIMSDYDRLLGDAVVNQAKKR